MPYADPEKAKETAAQRYRKNRDERLAMAKRYAAKNREAIRAYQIAYHASRKEEVNAKARAARAANPKLFRERERLGRLKNLEHEREIDRLRYQRDKVKIKARVRVYVARNPDKRADAEHRRRALKIGAVVKRVLRAAILERDGPNCALCGIETTQPVHLVSSPQDRHYDHRVPLARGGAHSMENMRILCLTCNTRKQARLDCELSWRQAGAS